MNISSSDSPPKNPDTNTEDRLLRQPSPESEIRGFKVREIQTAVRSVIVPEDKIVERLEFIPEPSIGIKPFLNFTVRLGMFHPGMNRSDALIFEILFEFTVPVPVLIDPMSAELAAMIHDQFTKRAYRSIFPNCSFDDGY